MKPILQKTQILFVALSLFLMSSCSNNSATIKGDVKNANGRKLYLEELNLATRTVIDSAKLNEKGTFSFRYKFKNDEPAFVILRADSLTLATLLVEKGEKLNYSVDFKQPAVYAVDGSQGSVLVKELNDGLQRTIFRLDSLQRIALSLPRQGNYDSLLTKLNYDMGAVVVKHKHNLLQFISKHATSYAAFTALYQRLPNGAAFFGKERDWLYFKTIADSLMPRYPQSPYVQALVNDYKRLSNLVAMQDMLNNAEVIDGVPDVELMNEKGVKVKLSSLRGKFVLLDFWAASNKAMLMDNKELQETYNKYHNRNFEIYQVSIDKDRDAWLQAIANQQLTWVSVMDAENSYAAKIFNISKLPANYLLDAKGEIVGKNLYGAALEKKLNEVLR